MAITVAAGAAAGCRPTSRPGLDVGFDRRRDVSESALNLDTCPICHEQYEGVERDAGVATDPARPIRTGLQNCQAGGPPNPAHLPAAPRACTG